MFLECIYLLADTECRLLRVADSCNLPVQNWLVKLSTWAKLQVAKPKT